MKKNTALWLFVLAGTVLSNRAGAEDDFTNHFSFSARFGFNISARFKGLTIGPAPASGRTTPNGSPYNYDNGYVLTDSSGNFGGQTWNWGYDNNSQLSGNNILLSRSTVTSSSTPAATVDQNPAYGGELVYSRYLGNLGHFHYGFELAANYMWLSFTDTQPRPVNYTRTTDAYPFTPGTTPPAASPDAPHYQGSFEGPGFVIGDTPVSSATASLPGAFSTGRREFEANVWGMRLGPYLELPVGEHLKLSLSAGFAGALVDATSSWTESITINGASGPSVSGSGQEVSLLYGYYVAGNVAWELNRDWSVVGSVQYQHLNNYEQTFGGRSVEVDLGQAVFVAIGLAYKF